MRNNIIYTNNKKPAAPNKVLKATALIYFQEALAKEEFEQCPELIQKAHDFGANKKDIQKVIAQYVKNKPEAPRYKPYKKKGQRRF